MKRKRGDPLDDFKRTLSDFQHEIRTWPRVRSVPIQLALIEQLLSAIPRGLAVVEADPARYIPRPPPEADVDGAAFVLNALDCGLANHEDVDIRWLVAAFCVMLTDLGSICRHFEELAARNFAELPWLVAGALWVEWESGQPATGALRDSLQRLRKRGSDFDEHLQRSLQETSAVRLDLLRIADHLLSDPSAVVPGQPSWCGDGTVKTGTSECDREGTRIDGR